jgi:hypothetical protein
VSQFQGELQVQSGQDAVHGLWSCSLKRFCQVNGDLPVRFICVIYSCWRRSIYGAVSSNSARTAPANEDDPLRVRQSDLAVRVVSCCGIQSRAPDGDVLGHRKDALN